MTSTAVSVTTSADKTQRNSRERRYSYGFGAVCGASSQIVTISVQCSTVAGGRDCLNCLKAFTCLARSTTATLMRDSSMHAVDWALALMASNIAVLNTYAAS